MNSAAVLDWALQTGMAVTLLIIFVLVIRRPFARYFGAQAAYALWALPVIRLFMPDMNIPIFKRPVETHMADIEALMAYAAPAAPALETASQPSISWTPIILTLWLGGAAVWLVYQLMSQSTYMNALREKTQPADTLSGRVVEAARRAQLKSVPEVRLAPDNRGPMVTGIMKPMIVLPQDFERRYTPAQQMFALLHECTHIRRRDLWAALAALAFRALNWPNPIVHYAARKFRADQEAACDASVIRQLGGDRDTAHGYAETLIHAARFSRSADTIQPLGLTIHHPLKERLMTLSNPKLKTGLLSRAAATVLIVAGIGFTAPLSLADPSANEGPVKTETKNKSKQVIKWTEKDDIGNETSKHYEIITVDGETTAYEIDAFGNKTEVDVSEVKGHHNRRKLSTFATGKGDGKMKVLRFSDGNEIKLDGDEGKHIIIEKLTEDEFGFGEDTEFPSKLGKGKREVIIKRLADGENANVFAFSTDDAMVIDLEDDAFTLRKGSYTKAMVAAAESMLSRAKTDDLDSDARRKVNKAQKALEEALEALEDAE